MNITKSIIKNLNESETNKSNVVKVFLNKDNTSKAEIIKIPNGKYKNYYYDTDLNHYTSYAGNYDSLDDAIKMINKHRPQFKEVEFDDTK